MLLRVLSLALFASVGIATRHQGRFVERAPLPRPNPYYGQPEVDHGIITPKVFIISLFTPESNVWLNSNLGLYAKNITVPGFSPLFPQAHCNAKGEICQLITGEGEINAASTITALWLSSKFNLKKTYFLIAGIAGVNPNRGTIGSVAYSRFAVQVGLEYEFDARDIPSNFSTGYLPLGSRTPNDYPIYLYGSEVFELNVALRDRAVALAQHKKFADSATAKAYRKRYHTTAARKAPGVIKCDTTTSDAYWHGKLLADGFDNYVTLLTNGTGRYCMSAQEDNAIMEAALRGTLAGRLDFSRIMLMRSGANFDRAPPGENEIYSFFNDISGGFPLSLSNLYVAGLPIIQDIIRNWGNVYYKGITPRNYIGDIFGSLMGPVAMDIGSIFRQEG